MRSSDIHWHIDHILCLWITFGPEPSGFTKPGLHPRLELGVECRAAIRRADFAPRLRSRLCRSVQFFNVLYALYVRHYDSLGFSVTCKTAWMPGVSTSSRRLLWEYSQKFTRTAQTVETLCIFLWSKLCYSFDALRPSKSEKITGFYDVLIGCFVILVEQRHARDILILDNWTTFALIVCDSSYMKHMKYMTPHSCKHTVSVALACIGMHWHVLLLIQAPSINHPSVHLSIHPSIYPSSVHLWI